MTETRGIPRELSTDSYTWSYHTYNDGTRHQWYRAMTDEEVRENTNGRFEGVDDIDFDILWNVTDYPVYMIELHDRPDSTWTVAANRTFLGSPRPGITDRLGGEWYIETDSQEEAVAVVREFAESLS